MKSSSPKLPLTDLERANLRKNKVKLSQMLDYAADELEVILDAHPERARELYALAEFQTIPSIGIKFAEDLVFLGYYSISELKGQDGAKLTDDYELKKGFWIDSCVEDQFRLAVHYANTGDASRTWWSFTQERKEFRAKNGYPADRPKTCWYDMFPPGKKGN